MTDLQFDRSAFEEDVDGGNKQQHTELLIPPTVDLGSLNQSVFNEEPPSSGPVRSDSFLSNRPSITRQTSRVMSIAETQKRKENIRQKLAKAEVVLQLTVWDKLAILVYNFIEPVLLSLIMGTAMQISEVGTALYMTISLCALLPWLLTEQRKWIMNKFYATALMIAICPIMLLMKIWIYCQFTPTHLSNTLEQALGVFSGQWSKTFLNDILVLLLSSLLIWHYVNQNKHAEARLDYKKNLLYQTAIKLHHPYFDKCGRGIFIVAYSLFFVDTLVYQTFVQLVILLVLLRFLHMWSTGRETSRKNAARILRLMQIVSFVFIALAFVLRMPGILHQFQMQNSRLMQMMGLETIDFKNSQQFQLLSIFHRIILSFAVVLTQAFSVRAPRHQQDTDQPLQKGLEDLDPNQVQPPPQTDTQRVKRTVEALANPKPLTRQQTKRKKKVLTWMMIWDQVYIPLMLWVCRVFCFIQVYRYHDYQSLVPLIWLIHSALFKKRKTFVWWIHWAYLPLFYACYLWYFIVNIFDLVQYTSWTPERTKQMYLYGFYNFKNPELELPLCLSALICIACYTRLNKLEVEQPLTLMDNFKLYSPSVYSYLYLAIVRCYVVIYLYMVLYSLVIMNLMHIIVLMCMVFAVYYPDFFHRHCVWGVGYAGLILFSMYLFTLIDQSESPSLYSIVLGFDVGSYDPQSASEYWRETPPYPTWFLLFFAAMLYRRNTFLGLNNQTIQKEIKKCEEKIAIKNPLTFKVMKYVMISISHAIVLLTFLVFLVTIYVTRRTLMNAISLFLVLTNLGVYMNKGLKPMLKGWKFIKIYQAFVLLALLIVQFLLYTKSEGVAYHNITNFWNSLDQYSQALMHYAGFYEFSDPLLVHFLPYITLYFGAIAVEPHFKQKVEFDERDVTQPVELHLNVQSMQNLSEPLLTSQTLSQSEIEPNTLQEKMKYYVETQRFYDMQHKRSYVVWKSQPLWPVFDFLSIGFTYAMFVFVFACAIYFSIALVWFIFLVLFMLQTYYIQRAHVKYKRETVRRFMEREGGPERFSQGRMTTSFNEKRLQRLEEKLADSMETNKKLSKEIEFARKSKAGHERILITDEEAVDQYRIYKSEIHRVSLEGREIFWAPNFTLVVLSLIFIYISVFIVTPSTQTNPQTLVPLQYPELRDKILFLFFWGGFYNEQVAAQSLSQYSGAYWPFFTMLFLLFLEKICQSWLRDRFDTSDETIEQLKKLELEYKQFQRDHFEKLEKAQQRSKPQRRASIVGTEIQSDFKAPVDQPEPRPSLVLVQEPIELAQDAVYQVQIRASSPSGYNPHSEKQKQSAQELHNEIYPLIIIKEKLNGDKTMRCLFEQLAILFVMMSLLYKQSVVSFILFLTLVYFTVNRFRFNGNPMLMVRYVVICVILLQYLLSLTNLTSYNSPQNFPRSLTNSSISNATVYTVYPNRNQMYFSDPWYFNLTTNEYVPILPNQQVQPKITIATVYFWGIDVAGRNLSGLWIDFTTVMILYFYLNNFSFWLIRKPIKIVYSDKTLELLQRYRQLKRISNDYTLQQIAKEIKQERTVFRFYEFCRQLLFQNFALIMISFLIVTSVFSHNFIALGYFIFSMYLVFNYRSFFKNQSARESQIFFLKYVLLTYILLDVLFQLVIQIPILPFTLKWIKFLGYVQVWTFTPATLHLGQNVTVDVSVTPGTSLTILFLKAVLLFLVFIQLDIVTSAAYLKFYDKILFENLQHIKQIGLGLAYRFNNFKNLQLKEQSQAYSNLDSMLREVKKLVKERQMMLNKTTKAAAVVKRAELDVPPAQLELAGPSPQLLPEKDSLSPEKQPSSGEIEQPKLERMACSTERRISFLTEYDREIRAEYKKRLSELNFMFRFYLWIRHNFVQDILFKHSLEHLFEIVKQYREGRTSVRCQIEIGIMISIREQWLESKLVELSELRSQDVISEKQFQEFQSFRRDELAKMALKPWERYDPQTYLSWKKLVSYLIVALYKVFVSYLELVCYLCMMVATIQNGGILYMVYPALVFGIAMCDEERPGKKFWYFVIFYTQLIILIQYVAQLTVWTQTENNGNKLVKWNNDHNFGIVIISDIQNNYGELFWLILPELVTLIMVLIHIQCETMAGIFNVSFYDYESFSEGLQRETQNMLDADEKFKKVFQQKQIESRRLIIDSLEVGEKKRMCRSQADLNELRGAPLNDSINDLNVSIFEQSSQSNSDTRPLALQLIKSPIQVDFDLLRPRSHSADLTVTQVAKKTTMLGNVKENAEKVVNTLWDNKYFDRLFPRIKQQKPGSDFYVWTAGILIVVIIYIVLAYNMMTLSTSSISQQFTDNQFSGAMVLSMLVVIMIMVIDRYFYSAQSFQNRKVLDRKLDTSSPLIGESSQGKSEDSKSQVESLKADEETEVEGTGNFQDWMVPQYIPKSPKRVLRYYFLWIVLILVHWYVFFFLTNTRSVCASQPYCNKFTNNEYLIWFYLIFCVYFAVSASQIKYGLPELKKGGFMLGSYSPVSKAIYYGWYYTPFLFELRTIIDWTFTTTALDVFQSISLAQIQSDMFVAKCYNKPYMEKELGKKISWIEKIAVGASLMIFILFLIAGPMLLFSSINPVGIPNPVASGTLSFYIHIYNPTRGIQQKIPLYDTVQLTMNQTLTDAEFDAMDFNNPLSQSNEFASYQSQALQFSPISDDVWGITEPKKALLIYALNQTLYNQTDDLFYAEAVIEASFVRDSASSVEAIFSYAYTLDQSTANLTTLLIESIQCNSAVGPIAWPITINSTISLNQNKQANTLNQQEPVTTGVITGFKCNQSQPSQDYWVLGQQFNPAQATYNETITIFDQINGFGFFVFNSDVLPNFLSAYASSVIFFYIAIVYVIASAFRSAFVPFSWEIFIINAPYTEKILMICQCIFIYRVQLNLKNEEELYFILLEIMRSPETIKDLTGKSLKKSLE